MNQPTIHIIILESSQIIYEGLYSVLSQSDITCNLNKVDSLEDLEQRLSVKKTDLLIVNPMQLANREKDARRIRKNHPKLSIIGINLGIIDQHLQSLLDASFTIFDSPHQIVELIQKVCLKNGDRQKNNAADDNLTDREVGILTLLVHGFSNKEIADSLNISVHTVVTHRKNIATKTGIRSQSGLVIYAISKKIVAIDDIDLQNH